MNAALLVLKTEDEVRVAENLVGMIQDIAEEGELVPMIIDVHAPNDRNGEHCTVRALLLPNPDRLAIAIEVMGDWEGEEDINYTSRPEWQAAIGLKLRLLSEGRG